MDIHVTRLDGDDVRMGLSADLGFSEADRRENLRRVAHVAELFNKNGNFVIATFVSPTEELRRLVRGLIKNFRLCYVRCSLETCEKRDLKGLYAKARRGEVRDFTGVSAPFEEPANAEITVQTDQDDVERCVDNILTALGIDEGQ